MAEEHASGSDLTVSSGEITSLLQKFTDAQEIISRMSGRTEEARQAVRATWSSMSAGEFSRGQEQLGLDIHRLSAALENLSELVRMSRDGFTAEEQEQASALKNVYAPLSGSGNPTIAGL
ncbi:MULTISPECIES: WXG100 family type VII secretion target [Streptomyces]|uniref:WXG100 family type VII secretion target n=1 Tax=Streptomyces TaxID=1883 RepID=UPI0004CA9750|nr:hypothetical protein [Streptomyces sp. NRRL F-2890]